MSAVTTFIFILPLILVYMVIGVYAERKIAGFIQDRLGPMEVGPYGLLQMFADLLKLLQKEDIIASNADKILFRVAPIVIFVSILAGFSVLPLAPQWAGANVSSAVFLLLAIVSLDVLGIIIAGLSSNNKYSMLGTMRSAAQIISYEVPLGLSVLTVCMVSETLNLQEMSYQQSIFADAPQYLFGVSSWEIDTRSWGGFIMWNVFKYPVLFLAWIIFFIASLAECNRAPFDLPEAESEIVAGYQTEYSGFRWAFLMMSEYAMMLLVSILGTILFFGSWSSPLPNIGPVELASWTSGTPGTWTGIVWGIFWLVSKSLFFVGLQIWVRWTYPRLRIDQLMNLSWKYLTPFALLLVIVCGFLKIILV